MNIFILDYDPAAAAQYHCDKHVIKMILESAQMLCTACNLDGQSTPYKTTHKNHPCNVWVRESLTNWLWLRQLAFWLNEEYRIRYHKKVNHKSWNVINSLYDPNIPDKGLTDFVKAMPEQYRNNGSVVNCYRSYYLGEKSNIAKWSNRSAPFWWRE